MECNDFRGKVTMPCNMQEKLYVEAEKNRMAIAREYAKTEIQIEKAARIYEQREIMKGSCRSYIIETLEKNLAIYKECGKKSAIHMLFQGKVHKIIEIEKENGKRGVQFYFQLFGKIKKTEYFPYEELRKEKVLCEIFKGNLVECGLDIKPSKMAQLLITYCADKFDGETCIKIPSKSGWFLDNRRYVYGMNADRKLHATHIIEKKLPGNPYVQEIEDILKDTLKAYANLELPFAGVCFLYRQIAFLNTLLGNPGVECTLGILGEGQRTVEFCKNYLSICKPECIINLNAHRINDIKKKLLKERDDITIIDCDTMERNGNLAKLLDVLECQRKKYTTGRDEVIEAIQVLCFSEPIKEIFTDSLLIFNVNTGVVENSECLGNFQKLAIEWIEKEWYFWKRNLEETYIECKKAVPLELSKYVNFLASVESVHKFICAILSKNGIEDQLTNEFDFLCSAGKEAIYGQIREEQNQVFVDMFKAKVQFLVEENEIVVIKEKVSGNIDNSIIYNDNFYNIPQHLLKNVIMPALGISGKSYINLLKQLEYAGGLQVYHQTKKEFSTDIRLKTKDGENIRLSVYRFSADFFDELGGIRLYERGRNDENIRM